MPPPRKTFKSNKGCTGSCVKALLVDDRLISICKGTAIYLDEDCLDKGKFHFPLHARPVPPNFFDGK